MSLYIHTLRVLPIHFGRETVPSAMPHQFCTNAAPMLHQCCTNATQHVITIAPAAKKHWAGACYVLENKEPAPAQYTLHTANTKVGPALGQSCSSINDAVQALTI